MSQTPAGPGWWMASDGRWYPPELHPSVRSAPPPPSPPPPGPVAAPPWNPSATPGSVPVVPGPTTAPPSVPAWAPSGSWIAPPGVGVPGPVAAPPARRRRHWWIVAVVGVVLVAVAAGVTAVALSPSGPSLSTLHVVSALGVSGDRVVVVDTSSDGGLQLSAVDPSSGAVTWQMPYGVSDITPGVAIVPEPVDGVVVDLQPAAGPGDPTVLVQGVDVATGAIAWTLGDQVVGDVPFGCAGAGTICITVQSSTGGQGVLLVVEATTGRVVRQVGGISRLIGGSLFQTVATAPTFQQLGRGGRTLWVKPVSDFFGPGYSPDDGWDFNPVGRLDVGTVAVREIGVNPTTGQPSPGATDDLAASKTAGITVADGDLAWTAPGAYQCGGSLQFVSPTVVCQFTGRAVYQSRAHPFVLSGVTLQLAGVDPATGRVTWRRPVTDVTTMLDDGNVPFADGDHVVVDTADGAEVLDLTTGATATAATGSAAYWCQVPGRYFHVAPIPGQPGSAEHVGAPAVTGCSASGTPSATHPPTTPDIVGVRVGDQFVWLSPRGLQVETVGG